MTVCPHCGTAYAVLPQKCAVCGEQLTDPGFTDPFAAALMQEAQTASEKEKKNKKKSKADSKAKDTPPPASGKKAAAALHEKQQSKPQKKQKSRQPAPGAARSEQRARLRMTAAIIGILAITAVVIWQIRQDYLTNTESESSITDLHSDPAMQSQLHIQEDTDYEAYSD